MSAAALKPGSVSGMSMPQMLAYLCVDKGKHRPASELPNKVQQSMDHVEKPNVGNVSSAATAPHFFKFGALIVFQQNPHHEAHA